MDRKDDTMNLEAIKALLSDVPDSGEFDLDSIIAEVEGGAPAKPKQTARPAPEPKPAPAPAPAPEPEPESAPRAGLFGRRANREQAETADEAAEPQAPAAHAPKTRRARREEEPQVPDPAAFADAPAEKKNTIHARCASPRAKPRRPRAAKKPPPKRRSARRAARPSSQQSRERRKRTTRTICRPCRTRCRHRRCPRRSLRRT